MADGQTGVPSAASARSVPRGARPLRFLVVVIAGWVCVRAAFIASEWTETPAGQPVLAALRVQNPPPRPLSPPVPKLPETTIASVEPPPRRTSVLLQRLTSRGPPALVASASPSVFSPIEAAAHNAPAPSPTVTTPAAVAPPGSASASASRWSGSAWAFVRRGEADQLAAGGTLGGSQVGGRILYRLTDQGAAPVSISGRVYASLEHPRESEAALGIEWQPAVDLPLRILAERRQRIGNDGRSAFSLLAYGGLSKAIGRLQADLYGQTGLVGIHSHDFFADGSARITAALDRAGKLRSGTGVWAAKQPGVSRVDVGPSFSYQFVPHLAVSADWRWRIAGHANPRSGPSLTLSTDF